ncbi:amino acid ABC transporter substrate-binding protein, partial [Rhizobium ruizarguesonis]
MLTRRVFFAMSTLAATFGFGSASYSDALADITARGTLRVSVPQDFPPFGSVGNEIGDIDIVAHRS